MVKRDDVARLAGVSPAVVSYVLNNGPRPVAEATRLRVVQAIEQLDYRPNGVARALRSRRTWSIGLVVPDNSNPFFAQLAHTIEDEAFTHGYSLLLGNASGDKSRELSYLRAFQDRQVDGLILVTNAPAKELGSVYEGKIPMVVIADHPVPGLAASTVKADNVEGARLATEHLIRHGHQRIGCVLGPRSSVPALERFAGWRRAMRDARLKTPQDVLRWTGFDRAGGYAAATELLSIAQPPTAVFVSTDQQAIGVLRAVVDAGLTIPGDLAVIGFDGIAEGGYTVPRLATVQQPLGAMAQRAIGLLLREAPTDEHCHEVFPMTLVPRGSCGCPDEPPRS